MEEPIVIETELLYRLGQAENKVMAKCWRSAGRSEGFAINPLTTEKEMRQGRIGGLVWTGEYAFTRDKLVTEKTHGHLPEFEGWIEKINSLIGAEEDRRNASRMNIVDIRGIHEDRIIRFPQPGGNAA